MDLPLPDWGNRGRPQPDRDAEPVAAQQFNQATTNSNRDSRSSDTAAATVRNLPPEQGPDLRPSDPSLPASQARTSRDSRGQRSQSQSPDNGFGSRSEITIQRPLTILGSLQPRKGSYGGPPDMETRFSHPQRGGSRSINSRVDPGREAPHQRSHRHDSPTDIPACSRDDIRQRSPGIVTHHSQGDRPTSHNNQRNSRSIAPTHRTHSQRSPRRSQTRPRPGSRGYYLDEESTTGYADTRLTSELRAPSVETDTIHTTSSQRRRRGYRLPWRRREASKRLQRAVAICTVALVALVILLVVLEFTVLRKKATTPQTS